MRGVRCPVLIGRTPELDAIVSLLTDAAATGQPGGALVVMGEAGVGKSRLLAAAADAAQSRGLVVARGRAAASSAPSPYRALSEALLSGYRRQDRPEVDELTAAAVAVLVPAWAALQRPLSEPSLVLLGEAALTLFEGLGSRSGALVVLEDLHWADAETLGVFEYMVDKLADRGVVVVASVRSGEGSAAELLTRELAARRHIELIELGRLPDDRVVEMMHAALGSDRLPAGLAPLIIRTADGLPLLVEELLAALVDLSALVRDNGDWSAPAELRPVVPSSFAASVDARVKRLDSGHRRVLRTAAVLGERFDWRLLADVLAVDDAGVIDGLRAAVELQLIEEDRGTGKFRFRHALTRTALLDSTVEPERVQVATRALSRMTAADSGRGIADVEVTADLAVMAGDPQRAAHILLDAASEALRRGAVHTARLAAERAAELDGSRQSSVRAREALLRIGVLAGDTSRVVEVGERLLAELAAAEPGALDVAPARRRAHLDLARAAVLSTDWGRARTHLDTAAADRGLDGEWDVLAAHLALGEHRIDAAERHARSALATSEGAESGHIRCEAYELLGRATRVRSIDAAERWFEEELTVAVGAGLELWRARALHELGSIDLLRVGAVARLQSASDLAADIGAPGLRAAIDFHLALLHYMRHELVQAETAADRATQAALRYELGLLIPAAAMVAGAIAAVRGDRAAAAESFEAARARSDAEVEATGRGNVLGLAALAAEDRGAAIEQFELAESLAPAGSGVAGSPFRGVLVLLRSLDGRPVDDADVVDLAGVSVITGAYTQLALAVAAAREGQRDRAAALAADADAALADAPWFRHVALRLVAEAALADGWGEPAIWLRRAVEFFDSAQLEQLSRAARSLLRATGSTVPRRQTTSGPQALLAAYGITRREADVLMLVADGLTSKQIAERLYLSPRTVEKHVERLLAKTHTANRAALAAFAVTHRGT